MKKVLCTFLLLILLFSLAFTGCSQDSGTAATTKQATETNQKVPVTIRFWNSVNDADPNNFLSIWTYENVKLFQEKNENIKIEFTNTPNGDQYLNKISTEMAANNAPDIFMTWVAGRLEPFVKAGRIFPLNDIIDQSSELKEVINPKNQTSTTFDGKIYAIALEAGGKPVYYNKSLFKKCGLEVPKTWDELLNVVKVLNENNITPFSLGNKDPWPGTIPFIAIFNRINGPDEADKVCIERQAIFNTMPYEKTANYIRQLVEAGAYPKNFNSLEYNEGIEMFATGKSAMRFNGTWELAGHIKALGDDLGMFNWVDMPEGVKGGHKDWITVQNNAYAISSSSQNKEAAVEFLKYTLSKDRQKELVENGYMIACKNIPYDESKVHPVAREISRELSSADHNLLDWDVWMGLNIGKELNLSTQAILAGADIKTTLENLNKAAEAEWK